MTTIEKLRVKRKNYMNAGKPSHAKVVEDCIKIVKAEKPGVEVLKKSPLTGYKPTSVWQI
jgi:hypothetical protein